MAKGKYKVYVDDNFHFMDESERYCAGSFDTFEQAVAKCKQIVDWSLSESAEITNNAQSLLMSYGMYGDCPFIVGPSIKNNFSASDYAVKRSYEIFPEKQN